MFVAEIERGPIKTKVFDLGRVKGGIKVSPARVKPRRPISLMIREVTDKSDWYIRVQFLCMRLGLASELLRWKRRLLAGRGRGKESVVLVF